MGVGWRVCGAKAARRFRRRGPVHQVAFSPEARLDLERLPESLPETVFLAGDPLGWTYQFWQASGKQEVKKSARSWTRFTGPLSISIKVFRLHSTT